MNVNLGILISHKIIKFVLQLERSLKILSWHDSPINEFSQYMLLCLNSLSKGLSIGENIRYGENLKIMI